MQQLSGSSGFCGTHTPATNTDFLSISERRSKGEDKRDEKIIAGPSVMDVDMVSIGAAEDRAFGVWGLLAIEGEELSRIEA
jgi:hypothetical protein